MDFGDCAVQWIEKGCSIAAESSPNICVKSLPGDHIPAHSRAAHQTSGNGNSQIHHGDFVGFNQAPPFQPLSGLGIPFGFFDFVLRTLFRF